MNPILIELGPLKLYTYGLLVATGFYAGILWAVRLGRKEGIDPKFIYDTAFWVIIAAILGSRFFYIIVNIDYFVANPLSMFKIWSGGLVFYGGFVGVFIALVICTRRAKVDLWTFMDVCAPAGALGHSIGRLGCFFAGCCYGKVTTVPWAVTFHDALSMAPTGVPLHPTQLYSSANELLLFVILTLMRPYRKFKGQIFLTWVLLYAVTRSIIEIFRGDPRGAYFNGLLSTSQIIAGVVFVVAVTVYYRKFKIKTT